jgi:peptide/nickel transport system substrate-binding protein
VSLAVSTVALLAVAGCGNGTEELSGTDAAGLPGGGGTLAWALGSRPVDVDPLFAETESEQLVARQIHEPLVAELRRPYEDGRGVPGLALSALPSSDRTVWRLRLRSGVRFQDGTPFNASAVLANVERWRATPQGRALIGDALADAPRPDLVRFILPGPDSNFDSRLASPRLAIVSPRALARAADPKLDLEQAAQSGTGPFELRERSSDRLLLAHNTDWWGTDRGLGPAIDQLEFTIVRDPSERLALLSEGSIQIAGDLRPDELARVRADPLLAVVAERGAGGLGIERSVRGIPAREPAPPLNGAWRTGIDAAQ